MMKTTYTGALRPEAQDLKTSFGGSLAEPYPWPYPWAVMPNTAIPFSKRGTIAAPANGTQANVTQFQCPQAMEAVILFILNAFNQPFDQGSGQITWNIDINRPLGSNPSAGYQPPDYDVITTSLGLFGTQGLFPWPVTGGIRLKDRDTARYKVTTTAPIPVGAPNYITCMLIGWYWPLSRGDR